jgi:hypothetical protein
MQAGPGGPAPRTAAEELDAVVRDGEPGTRGDPYAERFGVGLGQGPVHVHDPATTHAGEMMVGVHVGVEAGRRRTRRWTDSAVGCASVPRRTSRTTRRGPVRRRPRARRAASEFSGIVLITMCSLPSLLPPVKVHSIDSSAGTEASCEPDEGRADLAKSVPSRASGCRVEVRSGRLSISGGRIEWRSPSGSGSREPGRTT